MQLSLYNTLNRKVEPFTSQSRGEGFDVLLWTNGLQLRSHRQPPPTSLKISYDEP